MPAPPRTARGRTRADRRSGRPAGSIRFNGVLAPTASPAASPSANVSVEVAVPLVGKRAVAADRELRLLRQRTCGRRSSVAVTRRVPASREIVVGGNTGSGASSTAATFDSRGVVSPGRISENVTVIAAGHPFSRAPTEGRCRCPPDRRSRRSRSRWGRPAAGARSAPPSRSLDIVPGDPDRVAEPRRGPASWRHDAVDRRVRRQEARHDD